MPTRITGHGRLRNLRTHLGSFNEGDEIVVALDQIGDHSSALERAGFAAHVVGETILPRDVGITSSYNAHGRVEIDKTQKEPYSYTVVWTRKEYRGPDRVEVTNPVDITRERYKRISVPAPGVEITVAVAAHGDHIVRAPSLIVGRDDELLTHTINLFKELFGECVLLDGELKTYNVQRLPWEVLPAGTRYDDPHAELLITPTLKRLPKGQRAFASFRLDRLTKMGANLVAVGSGGFANYLVFEVGSQHVFETIDKYGNATYIVQSEDWEDLTRLTKRQLRSDPRFEHRVIHSKRWADALINALGLAGTPTADVARAHSTEDTAEQSAALASELDVAN